MASGRKPKADAVSNPTTGGPIGQVSAGDGVKAIDAAAPFGGMKESGLGREGAAEGIDEYLNQFSDFTSVLSCIKCRICDTRHVNRK
jgi:acyl-CoA reductase-like NAD-dependent aldehyde dehydrogenase